jgi:O-acetyl-ADP-ribose deacetylase (regulator of RNase III)
LKSAVWESLNLAARQGFVSLSLPAISSGIFGYPKERCAEVLLDTTLQFLKTHPQTPTREIRFCISTNSPAGFSGTLPQDFGESDHAR